MVENPAQGDWIRAMDRDDPIQASLARLVSELGGPFLYLSGNHEDHGLIAGCHASAAGAAVVPIDPGGVFGHVADGAVVQLGPLRVAFLGGIALPGAPYDLDAGALASLADLGPGSVDVLVTHDGPYGLCASWRGHTQGSRRLRRLIDSLAPPLHVSGHYHQVNGPRQYGPTRSYMLAALVEPKRDPWHDVPVNPSQRVTASSVGLLHDDGDFEYVNDRWLTDIEGDTVDLDRLRGLG